MPQDTQLARKWDLNSSLWFCAYSFHYISVCPQLGNEDNGDIGREEGPRRDDSNCLHCGDGLPPAMCLGEIPGGA